MGQLHHWLAAASVAAVARLGIAGQVEKDNVSTMKECKGSK